MKRKLLFISLLVFCFAAKTHASHITGGTIYYEFAGMNGSQFQYTITLKLFQRCGSGRNFPNPNIVSIFDNSNRARVNDYSVNITNSENINLTNHDPCISNPPEVCYDIAYYTFTVSLPAALNGYTIASQVNYRINGINNLEPGSGNIGATYTAEIPGTEFHFADPQNSSAVFSGSDLVEVCAGSYFSYSFAADDPDGDELRYSFCSAYNSTAPGGGTPIPPNPPAYPNVPYYSPSFFYTIPMGNGVSLNTTTGQVSGIGPGVGIYVVTVCVEEIRGGHVIATQRKDLQIVVADCNVASATLQPDYYLCKTSMTLSVANLSVSPLINTTDWEVYDNANTMIHSYSGSPLIYTFPVAGDYTVKLVINRNGNCSDSTTAGVKVYPGFAPDFSSTGICVTKPTIFTDYTTSVYGVPDSWSWDFGEPTVTTDVSNLQHPTYSYPTIGDKRVRLIATDTKGCRDTVFKTVPIIDKPPVALAFRDTLICVNDRLMLIAGGSGVFSWTPPYNITGANTATPIVAPLVTTTYYVDLDDNGCKNRDSVKVNVVDHVTLIPMSDTIICKGDTIQLRVLSDGLRYSWSPAANFIDPLVKYPFAVTHALTDYTVTATIGGCTATTQIRVTPIPYPLADAGPDQVICYNKSTQLHGITDGISWSWSPANRLNNPNLLNPVAFPPRTTDFIFTADDNKGCPKPGRDTVTITVLPKMRVSAGNDTAVVTGQPLQLQAAGGETYSWSPPFNLSSTTISNPVAVFNEPAESLRYKVVVKDVYNCSDSAYLTLKVFKAGPRVYVPTAFTPNSDGRNDVLRPIAAGIKNIEYFSIYNRWGQLLFTTTINGKGWDGKVNGQLQSTGTFVWMVKATDFNGQPYFEKGVVTLIR